MASRIGFWRIRTAPNGVRIGAAHDIGAERAGRHGSLGEATKLSTREEVVIGGDASIDVRFDATETGTIVRLEATIPEGGTDTGGSAFIAVTPRWFGAWVAKRDTTAHELHDRARFGLTVHYAEPAAAARWLAAAFGFESPNALPDGEDPLPEGEHGQPWIEFHVGNCSVMIDRLVGPSVDHTQLTHMPWVFVDALEAHFARSQENGATIVQGITSYGFKSSIALDIEGRSWRFAEARPTQPP